MMDFRSAARVLVVDDFEPFRRFVCQTLQENTELEVVAEACDGLEAVRKAQQLQPDLVFLDFRLPKLDGIAAALEIRKLSPNSKILLVSQNMSAALAQAALAAGAKGYVVKSDAGRELLPAVQAVLKGEIYVSSRLAGKVSVNTGQEELVGRPPSPVLAPLDNRPKHEVAFYPDDASLVEGCKRCIQGALRTGSAVIFVATEPHRAGVLEALSADGVNVSALIEEGSYIPLDAAEILSKIMVDNLPDLMRLKKVLGDLIAASSTTQDHPRIAACGECAPTLLLSRGNADAALQLEHLWDEIAVRGYGIDTFCTYLTDDFQSTDSSIFERIRAGHSAVYG